MKIKKFFIWLAWLNHKDSTRCTVVLYGSITVFTVLFSILLRLIFEEASTAAAVAFGSLMGIGMLIIFIAGSFFSGPDKNWRIAIYEAEKIIVDYPEMKENQYGVEYLCCLKLFKEQLHY